MQENQTFETSVQDDGKIHNSQHSEELLDSSPFEKGSCQGDILENKRYGAITDTDPASAGGRNAHQLEGHGFNADIDNVESDLSHDNAMSDEEKAVRPKEEPEPNDGSLYLTGVRLYSLVCVLCVVAFLVMLSSGIIATAIPSIVADLHSTGDIGWYGSAYLLATCSIQPLNRRRVVLIFIFQFTFLVFLTVFEIGSAVCGAATSSDMLIVGRAVAGMGGAGLVNGVVISIASAVPLQRRPVFMSLIMSCVALGQVASPLIGGAVTEHSSWRWCFYMNLPMGGFCSLILLIVRMPDTKDSTRDKVTWRTISERLDLVGFVTFGGACVMLLLPLQWGGVKFPWDSSIIIGLFIGSFAAFCVFGFWQHKKGDAALIPLSIFQVREVVFSGLTTLFSRGAMFLHVYYLPLWFQMAKQATPFKSGLMTIPSFIAQIPFSMAAGFAVQKFGYYTPLAAAGAALSAIGSGLLSTFTPSSGAAQWIGYQVIIGIGRGLLMQMPVLAVQAALPPEKTTLGITFSTFCQSFGGALFIALGQTVFTNRLPPAITYYSPDDNEGMALAYSKALTEMFYFVAGIAALGCLTSWGMGFKSMKNVKSVRGMIG
ncbi:hypothetical protein V491_06771 [Pseudogymnoascus sp. VKM F-3775]|nr:hypothetical protein V491_06771 [Pseudogymnoascus sp. VKM F-3775]